MKLFKKRNKGTYAFTLNDAWNEVICSGDYVRLSDCPEIIAGCRAIADLVSSMTIYLMSNTEKGDKRIKNELSRKIDINPYKCMTRKTWMDAIVMNLLLYGKGNSVVLPITRDGILEDLQPIPASQVRFEDDKNGAYNVIINNKAFSYSEVCHFVYNPDKEYLWKGQGITAALNDVAGNLKQAAATEKEFMSSKWKPSIIVKVDGLIDEFASPDGRQKLLDDYFKTNRAGEPWLIPSDQFQVEQIRPLSLSDLAINTNVEMDKKTVAAVLGVPLYLLGVGPYKSTEWNNFISTKIRTIAEIIQQEMTKKILISPNWYFKLNYASLYAYDIQTIASVYGGLYTKGIVDGNEVRDKLSMSPREGLDELVMLENYIPVDKAGDQKKLIQEEDD